MKATIHFDSEKPEVRFSQIDLTEAAKNGRLSNSFSDLEKLRLEAVIQKEAEEKYPYFDRHDSDIYIPKFEEEFANERQDHIRGEYINWWRDLIERLPSEEEIDKRGDKLNHGSVAYKAGAKWFKSKLLPSLPSTLSCEVEEENGKIEVKKLTI